MIEDNFYCRSCERTYFVTKYRKVFRDGDLVLEKVHPCPTCHSEEVEEVQRKINYKAEPGTLNFIGKFSSASDEKKKEILEKRAALHYNKRGKEQKREYFKNAMRKMSE